jgi:hypothetical protein
VAIKYLALLTRMCACPAAPWAMVSSCSLMPRWSPGTGMGHTGRWPASGATKVPAARADPGSVPCSWGTRKLAGRDP